MMWKICLCLLGLVLELCTSKTEIHSGSFCPDIFPPKSGACPWLPLWTSCDCKKENVWCRKDSDCPGREKCCTFGCGCRTMCIKPDFNGFVIYPPPLHSICQLPRIPGPCIAAIPRWWYNMASRQCEIFRFGGCCGNRNNFLTKEDCEFSCLTVYRK
ncbi:eppin-like [Saccostrea cucullata]|uniref:eppin-like n=1 Tax=Saccostrea cuccullata TaxID=36930 RepID=UPI002ED4AC92